jgi:hypothetical protein
LDKRLKKEKTMQIAASLAVAHLDFLIQLQAAWPTLRLLVEMGL